MVVDGVIYILMLAGDEFSANKPEDRSNNLVLDSGKKVLIQSSVPYYKGCTNVAHWMLEME